MMDEKVSNLMHPDSCVSPLTPPECPKNEQKKRYRPVVLSHLALQRRQKLQDAQKQAEQLGKSQQPLRRMQKRWKNIRKTVDKVNVGRWIDDLERDEELAGELERLNDERQEEVERRRLVQQVRESCMEAIRTHLKSFLEEKPDGMYEDWIYELHPDNISESDHTVDSRFYIENSDHRLLWNEFHPACDSSSFGFSKFVPAMTVREQDEARSPNTQQQDGGNHSALKKTKKT